MSLSFQNITVDYASASGEGALRALSELNLEVKSGESIAIIGPSGCGKSTMLRLAAGLLAPTSGRVLLGGEEVLRPRAKTGLILQDFGLLPWKDVYHNAELGLLVHGVPKSERASRTKAALERVGLAGFECSYPSELSGGMQQRLALARAIATDVDTLLMDEPLSALDAFLREELQQMLLELWRTNGHTQVLVTHSIEEAVFLGERIVVMCGRPGRVVACIENPSVGTPNYRTAPQFFERCREIRSALDAAITAEASSPTSAWATASTREGVAEHE